MWLVFVCKVLESFAYFITSLNFTLFLTSAYGVSDVEAATAYGVWGVCASVLGAAVSPLIDRMGVRTSLLLGGSVSLVGRVMFAGAPMSTIAYVSLFVVQTFGMCLGIPVLTIAVRRLAPPERVSVSFGTFYACMNVGALAAGLVTDGVRSVYSEHDETYVLRILLWSAAGASLLYLCAVACIRSTFVVPESPPLCGSVRSTLRDTVFWRLAVLSIVLLGARSIFRHIDATLPKWLQRTLGQGVPYGTLYAINPLCIIVLVPLLQHLLRRVDSYTVIGAGTLLSAAAPFILGLAAPSIASVATFMVVVSLGEATYSPRAIEYAMALAPVGQEAVYSTLASTPLFLVKLLVGNLSGQLLESFCPQARPTDCGDVWTVIGCIAASTPACLAAGHKWLYSERVRERITSNVCVYDDDSTLSA